MLEENVFSDINRVPVSYAAVESKTLSTVIVLSEQMELVGAEESLEPSDAHPQAINKIASVNMLREMIISILGTDQLSLIWGG
jgi:hypothetical protein